MPSSDLPPPDQQAERFARLWTSAQGPVAGFIRSMVADRHLAEDVLQDVALVCLRRLADYDPERSFISWALGIAKFTAMAAVRSARRVSLLDHPEAATAVAAAWERLEDESARRRDALALCLGRLPGRQRTMLAGFYQEGRSIVDIAKSLGLASDSVKTMLSRVRTALRRCVEERLEPAP